MTHDELLAKIDAEIVYCGCDGYVNCGDDNEPWNALRAVVELHKPIELNVGDEFHYEGCLQCDRQYPCPTIQAIQEQLK